MKMKNLWKYHIHVKGLVPVCENLCNEMPLQFFELSTVYFVHIRDKDETIKKKFLLFTENIW